MSNCFGDDVVTCVHAWIGYTLRAGDRHGAVRPPEREAWQGVPAVRGRQGCRFGRRHHLRRPWPGATHAARAGQRHRRHRQHRSNHQLLRKVMHMRKLLSSFFERSIDIIWMMKLYVYFEL